MRKSSVAVLHTIDLILIDSRTEEQDQRSIEEEGCVLGWGGGSGDTIRYR